MKELYSTFVEGEVSKFINKTIPSVGYPRLMQPRMLQLSILALNERLHLCLWGGSVLQVNPTPLVPIGGIEEETLHPGINNMKTLLEIISFLYWDRNSKEWLGQQTSISFVLWIPV